jgi:thymidylate kinase
MAEINTGRSARLIIFEGPDGSGKSSFAKEYAAKHGAQYVHFPALPRVNKGLGRMYVEAMLPALLGYQDVVFDRCWLSELPYGVAFREGYDRLGVASRRMLERLALRCNAVVIRCNPGWELVKTNYMARKHLEMLDNVEQLQEVYNGYMAMNTALRTVEFNYTVDQYSDIEEIIEHHFLGSLNSAQHPLELKSAGSWLADVVLVGENFAERKDQDPWYQWPFASFSNEGCSQWLTQQLERGHIAENQLLWVNADQDLTVLQKAGVSHRHYIALGRTAEAKLREVIGKPDVMPHPQSFKRFNYKQPYPLIPHLHKLFE